MASRPAEPHEVVELVKRHLASRIEPEAAEESVIEKDILGMLAEVTGGSEGA